LLEVQPLYGSKRVEGDLVYQSPLQSEFWQAAANNTQHILLLPAAKAHAVYQPFALYARRNGMTLNWGYFSRANLGAIRDHGNQAWQEILAGRADKDSLYIFWDPGWEEFMKADPSDKIILSQVDGYTVGFSRENDFVHTELDTGYFFTLP